MRALLRPGEDVNRANFEGWTPLYMAASEGHMDIVNALLEAGADPNEADNRGQTPLYRAAYWGHTEIVEALLEAGADPAQADDMERTPLQVAAANGHMNILVYLKSVIQERQDAVIESLSFHKATYEMTELILKKSGLYI